jgi:hypothetical protein
LRRVRRECSKKRKTHGTWAGPRRKYGPDPDPNMGKRVEPPLFRTRVFEGKTRLSVLALIVA